MRACARGVRGGALRPLRAASIVLKDPKADGKLQQVDCSL